MNINGISSYFKSAVQPTAPTPGRVEKSGGSDGDTKRTQGSRQEGGQVLNAVAQTLGQLGIGTISPTAPPPVRSTQPANSNNDPASAASNTGQNVGQAVQSFMHSLFQNLGSTGGNNPPPAPQQAAVKNPESNNDRNQSPLRTQNASRGYGDLSNRLQNLAQSLSSNSTASSGTEATSDLNSAFNNLKQALQGKGGTTASGASTDLQSFLTTLSKNVQSSGSGALATRGNLISIKA